MRRTASVVLIVCLALLGTGIVQHLHRMQHEQQIASHSVPCDSRAPHHPQPADHRDSQCLLCLKLHQPVFAAACLPALIGVFAPIVPALPAPVSIFKSLPIEQIDCRGPPSRSTHD